MIAPTRLAELQDLARAVRRDIVTQLTCSYNGVEVFRADTLGKADARPVLIENAHPDAKPIHIGLGREKMFDLRVTFPGKSPLELKNVQALGRQRLTPDGKITPLQATDR